MKAFGEICQIAMPLWLVDALITLASGLRAGAVVSRMWWKFCHFLPRRVDRGHDPLGARLTGHEADIDGGARRLGLDAGRALASG